MICDMTQADLFLLTAPPLRLMNMTHYSILRTSVL